MEPTHLAVLMTCFNRCQTTLACLDALSGQEGVEGVKIDVYLVDDGCTDGTAEMVHLRHPKVKIIPGNGNYFWGGGMRLAWAEAFKSNYELYLWLNDDTILFPRTLRMLLDTSHLLQTQEGRDVILGGSTFDPGTKKHTYGGVVQPRHWQPTKFVLLEPSDKPQRCDTIHGNCVLIPRWVAQEVGNLSPDFTHGLGDFDYGLRAKHLGISCWIAPGYVGTCPAHEWRGSFYDPCQPTGERLKMMHSPTGLPPVSEWMHFTRRHAGPYWPICWLRTWIRACFPRLWLIVRNTLPE
jgi:GT2 family glycosyltransferase